jgi:hypothetical protein
VSDDGSPVVRVSLPRTVDGFRFARISDGTGPDGGPLVSAARGHVDDPAERGAVLAYLRAGAVVLAVGGLGLDVFEPARGEVVPLGSRTDGEWIWSDGVAHYLEHHGVAPEPELYQRIRDRGYRCPQVAPVRAGRAGAAVRERYRLARDARRRP